MQFTTTKQSITHKILNETTGELEPKQFDEIVKKKRIKGGFRMIYKSYDDALLSIVKSTKDLELVIFIRDMFTYRQVEVNLSTSYLQEQTGMAKSKITEVISRMVAAELLRKVRRGVYKLNPYMYVPFRADAETLQAEWLTLIKENT
jgi:hypothetical protein